MTRPATVAAALALCLAFLSSAGCGGESSGGVPSRPEKKETKYERVIMAMGDSLTAGLGVSEKNAWPALVQMRLTREGYPWKVVNAGISGETSSGARSRIGWTLSMKPDIVILETGANDGLRGIPPRVVRENIDAILGVLGEQDVVTILAGMRMVWNLGEEYTSEFGSVYPDLAEKHGVSLVPFFLEGVAGVDAMNQSDGIHPNEAGHRKIADIVYPFVLESIEEVRRDGGEGTAPPR